MKRIILVLVIVLCMFSCGEKYPRLDWNNVPMHNIELVEQYLEEQGYKYNDIGTITGVDSYEIEDSLKPDISLCHNKKGDINGMIFEDYKSMSQYDKICDSLKNKYKDCFKEVDDSCTIIHVINPYAEDEIIQEIVIHIREKSDDKYSLYNEHCQKYPFEVTYRDMRKGNDGWEEY